MAGDSTSKIPDSYIPKSWPGAFGLYKYAKKTTKKNVSLLVIFYVTIMVVNGVLNFVFKNLGNYLSFFIGALGTTCFTIIWLKSTDGKVLEIGDVLNEGIKYWLNVTLASLLVAVTLIVSFLLLVVPFFIVLPRLMMVNYYIVDKNLGVMDSFKASWNATKGHSAKIWGIVGVSILICLLFITIIGIPFAIYFLIMYSSAFAVMYKLILSEAPQLE